MLDWGYQPSDVKQLVLATDAPDRPPTCDQADPTGTNAVNEDPSTQPE